MTLQKAAGRLASGCHDAQHADGRAGVHHTQPDRDFAGQSAAAVMDISRPAKGARWLVGGAHEQD